MKIIIFILSVLTFINSYTYAQIQLDSINRDPANVSFVNNQLLLPDGSASAPSYSFSSDTDLGMYNGGLDKLLFATGGSERVMFANGKVRLNSISSTIPLQFGPDSNFVSLFREGLGILSQKGGTNPQEFRVYNTDDGAGNTEYGTMSWNIIANRLDIGATRTGTGVLRNLMVHGGFSIGFAIGGTEQWRVASNLFPVTDNTYTLGQDNLRPSTVYTYDLDAKGTILASDGLVTAPSYSFSSDPSTGWYTTGGTRVRLVLGGIVSMDAVKSSSLSIDDSMYFGWATDLVNIDPDTRVYRDDAGIIALRNGTNPQEFRVYNTDDEAGNVEYGMMSWNESVNILTIGAKQTGTGLWRGMYLQAGTNTHITFRLGGGNQWAVQQTSFAPSGDNLETLGTDTARPSTIYTYKLSIKDGGAKPTCDSTERGSFWIDEGGAGVKDTVEVCAKDAGDAYAWRTIY